MLYTEFFAVLSLVFYATENPEKPGSGEVLADARAGRQMIAALAEKSMSAERVTSALKVRPKRSNSSDFTDVVETGSIRSITRAIGCWSDTTSPFKEETRPYRTAFFCFVSSHSNSRKHVLHRNDRFHSCKSDVNKLVSYDLVPRNNGSARRRHDSLPR
jgi:hypothetical protein